jgi:hypothetical protein
MKIIGRLLLLTMMVQLLAPIPAFARQTAEANIAQLREQIARLERIDLDPETSPDVRALNREFLRERQTQLSALVRRRVAALRQYLVTAGDALRPQERQAVEESIRALNADLQGAEPRAEIASAPPVQSRAELPAPAPAAPRPDARREAAFSGTLLSPGAYLPETRTYLPASEVVPGSPRQEPLRADAESKKNDLTINTNTPAKEVPKPLEVDNGTVVTVKGSKSFINKCVVATKREEIQPEPNPLAQIIKVLFGLGAFNLAKSGSICDSPVSSLPTIPNPNPGPASIVDPEAARIETEIDALRASLLATSATSVLSLRADYEKMADRITHFAGCEAVRVVGGSLVTETNGGKETYVYDAICDNESAFNNGKNRLKNDLVELLKLGADPTARELPAIESAEVRLAAIRKAITEGYKGKGGAVESAWIDSVNRRLDCLAQRLEAVRKSRAFLQTASAQFESFYELLDAHKTRNTYEQPLIADSNAKVTGTVTCTNFFTKQPAFDPIPFTVKYQSAPRGTVTAGIIYSTLDKRQIGIVPVLSGTAADGSDTFRLTFGETDRGSGQIIPFTFYNHRLWGDRKYSLNGSGGVGVNPNNGATQVEFFFGGSVGIKNVFLQFGGHVGRWQELGGGFVIGDAVTAAPPSVPIERRYSVRPAVGVSYKIPLP